MLNNISLCGRLTATPELKVTPSGINVVSFTVAVERDYTRSEEKQADFINCVAWRGTAEFISKYFTKGKMILINGRLQVRKYTTQDGENRYITEVVAENVYFAGDKSTETKETGTTTKPTAKNNVPQGFIPDPDDEDLPF